MASTTSKSAPTKFCRLFPRLQIDNNSYDLSIILVPDYTNKTAKSNLEATWNQLSTVLTSIPGKHPLVLGLEYKASEYFESVWNFLSLCANNLMKCIALEIEGTQLASRPLLFVCHGLGGLIVKQAMTELNDQYLPPALRRLQKAHIGTVLLGTPHPVFSQRNEWFKLTLILRSRAKLSSLQLAQAESEAAMVAGLCHRFDQSNITVPLLSFCETETTKVSRGLFSSDKYILVDKKFASTALLHEELVEVKTDHYGICSCQNNSITFTTMTNFIQSCLSSIAEPSLIDQASPTDCPINDELIESIAASVISKDIGVRKAPQDSNEAVLNTTDRSSTEHLPILADLLVQEKNLPTPCHLLKGIGRNFDFIGRQDVLEEIDKALSPQAKSPHPSSNNNLQCFALCGLGGVGKTQVAIEYAFLHKADFDAVFWLEADSGTKVDDGFGNIALHLGFNDASDKDRVVSRSLVHEWLSKPLKRPVSSDQTSSYRSYATWLMVFNNVDDLELLADYWPVGGTGSILITSRDPLVKTAWSGLDLESFAIDEAAEFLRLKLKLDSSPENLKESTALAERLGGFPLGLSQAASLVANWDMTLKEFLIFYEKETSKAEVAKENPTFLRDNYYQHSLFTVWSLETLKPHALTLLQILSFLDPDEVQESLVTEYASQESRGGFGIHINDYLEARKELTKVSLIKRIKEENKLTVHRLVQDVVQAHMISSVSGKVFSHAVHLVKSAWPTEFLQFEHDMKVWAKSEELLQHILKLQQAYENHPSWVVTLETTRNLAKLLLFAGWYLYERSDFFAAKPLLLHALDICRAHPIEMEDILADNLFCLSAWNMQTRYNKAEDLKYTHEHYALRQKLRDGSEESEARLAMAEGEMGQVLMIIGQFEDSVKHCKVAIDLTERSPRFLSGDDWPTWSHCTQAFSLSALGDFDEAFRLVKDTERYYLQRRAREDESIFHLGLVYRCSSYLHVKQGRQYESFVASKLALKHFKGTVGANSRYTSQVCSNLGAYHLRIGQYETARIYFEQAIAGFEVHPWYAAELARTLWRFSQLQEFEGDSEGASVSQSKAHRIYKQLVSSYTNDEQLSERDFDDIISLQHR